MKEASVMEECQPFKVCVVVCVHKQRELHASIFYLFASLCVFLVFCHSLFPSQSVSCGFWFCGFLSHIIKKQYVHKEIQQNLLKLELNFRTKLDSRSNAGRLFVFLKLQSLL